MSKRLKRDHFFCAALLTGAFVSHDAGSQAAQEQDKSGTNPANFSESLQLRTEYYSLDRGDYGSRTQAIYSMPFGAKSKFEFEVPFLVGTDFFGPNLFGFGDVSVSWKARPYLSHKMAIIAGVELFAPSGTRDELSANRWSLGPTATVAFFFPSARMIFAPTYQQQFQLTNSPETANFDPGGGDSNTGGAPSTPRETPGDINTGTFDFYLVYRFANNRSWITIDPAISIDYENDAKIGASISPSYGFFVKPGASVSFQPVIPLTSGDLEWGAKITVKQVF